MEYKDNWKVHMNTVNVEVKDLYDKCGSETSNGSHLDVQRAARHNEEIEESNWMSDMEEEEEKELRTEEESKEYQSDEALERMDKADLGSIFYNDRPVKEMKGQERLEKHLSMKVKFKMIRRWSKWKVMKNMTVRLKI